MEITTTTTDRSPRRQAALNSLAVVGFIALILIGIALAIYAVRYLPKAIDRLGTASVSLSSIFKSNSDEPKLDVVSGTEIPFSPVATSTATTSELILGGTGTTTPATTTRPTYTRPVPQQTITVPVNLPPPAPYGKADLTVKITSVGYCTSGNTYSFVSSNSTQGNQYGGVRFTIRNIGTNIAGRFDFAYDLPAVPSVSQTETVANGLNPNDAVEYTLCFSDPSYGNGRPINIRVDTRNYVDESNEFNNSDTAYLDVRY